MRTRQPGFFGSLFDLSFRNYVTSRIVRGAYRLVIMLTVNATMFTWLVAYALPWWVGWEVKIAIFALAATSAIIGLVIARVTLEYFVVIFQIDEKLTVIAEHTVRDPEANGDRSAMNRKNDQERDAAPSRIRDKDTING